MYKLCLTVKGRVRNEEKFVLDDEVISLARGDGHTIQIDWDIYVSREAHACIERVDAEKGYFRLQDMNSDWGTYITYPKQKEVEVLPDKPYWLCNGAVILLMVRKPLLIYLIHAVAQSCGDSFPNNEGGEHNE
ncbi:MAG: hypothetical protein B6242_06845 [Anaerolineaceae bacterium 4572_78]|nr:MAG: hypothetical protein B6242_06845 [Anaerolineaceae bacterium 4572_78]